MTAKNPILAFKYTSARKFRKTNILLRLRETHNALQLPVFFFFFLFFCQRYPEYRGIRSKKLFYRPLTVITIQLFVPVKRKFFWSILFQSKSQQTVIPYRLLDKYSHLFICISLKRDIKYWTKTCLHFQNHSIRTNNLCCSALIWVSLCFLQVN